MQACPCSGASHTVVSFSHTLCFPHDAPCGLREPGEVDSFIDLLCAKGRLGIGKMKMEKSPALQDLIAHIIRQEG